MDNEFGRTWKEEVVGRFRELRRHLPRDTEGNHEKSKNIRFVDRDRNPALPQYEAGVYTTLLCSV